jgi:hypothetical protein
VFFVGIKEKTLCSLCSLWELKKNFVSFVSFVGIKEKLCGNVGFQKSVVTLHSIYEQAHI